MQITFVRTQTPQAPQFSLYGLRPLEHAGSVSFLLSLSLSLSLFFVPSPFRLEPAKDEFRRQLQLQFRYHYLVSHLFTCLVRSSARISRGAESSEHESRTFAQELSGLN